MATTPEFVVAFAAAFLMTFLIVPWLILKLKANGIVGKDLNKPDHPEIAEMGGIAVVLGFFAGVSVLLAFDGVTDEEILNISLSVVLGAAFIGMIDDLFDLRQRQKAFFPFLLALPLGAALDPSIDVPIIGSLNFGVFMIVAAPLAITCAANAGNMLEGFNGLGSGLGIIMTGSIVVCTIEGGFGESGASSDGLYILIPLLGGLAAFIWFNKYPAKVFPGDTLMLFMGASIAMGGMLSRLYAETFIIFLPMIIEFVLKLRGHFKAENYCTHARNGYLEYSGRIESLTHIVMRHGKVTEQRLVGLIWLLEIVVCSAVVFAAFVTS